MQAWLEQQAGSVLMISDWTVTEFSSALAIKLRTGQLDPDSRATAIALFHRLVTDSFDVLPVSSNHFRIAAKFADHHELGLRAGDALHLAVAADHGATACTLDRRMAAAGPALGVQAQLLG